MKEKKMRSATSIIIIVAIIALFVGVPLYMSSPKIDFVLKDVKISKIEINEFDSTLIVFHLVQPQYTWLSKKDSIKTELRGFVIIGKKLGDFTGVTKFKKVNVAMYNHFGDSYYDKMGDIPVAVKWKI
jgi:hypothetical protein